MCIRDSPKGLCVVKVMIYKYKNSPDKRRQILYRLEEKTDELVQDPYGNYAIQYTLENFAPEECSEIYEKILQKIVQLSLQKYSSNVIEKCLTSAPQEYRGRFFGALCEAEKAVELMKNKYGNFVLIKALRICFSEGSVGLYQLLLDTIIKNIDNVNVPKYKSKWKVCLGQDTGNTTKSGISPVMSARSEDTFTFTSKQGIMLPDFSIFFSSKKAKQASISFLFSLCLSLAAKQQQISLTHLRRIKQSARHIVYYLITSYRTHACIYILYTVYVHGV
eukprot:TRINITY_DN7009_c0_g1_i5.p1 TRINITY_DN7009_c0_g1~~TRINITY_DN7009_c0_g1_i5.p1  ORF type:complete len:277 (-),score=31.51 TRINITY_DN7009_c0_g1_i5:74-904(-)